MIEMTADELNQALVNKCEKFHNATHEWLMKQSPEEILNHADTFWTEERMIAHLKEHPLPEEQAKALLTTFAPLVDLALIYRNQHEPESIGKCLADTANKLAAENQKRAQCPVYPNNAEYAREHNETEQYRASAKLNIQCCKDIQDAIRTNYDDNRLRSVAVHQVVAKYGLDRTEYVLANTVQQKSWDGRFSPATKEWAAKFQIPEDKGILNDDRRYEFAVNSHPGLTNLFISLLRSQCPHKEQQDRPSVRAKLRAKPPIENGTNRSAHSKEPSR